MAKNAATHPAPAPSPANRPVDSGPALAPVIDINVRHIGRTLQPERLTGSEAPEGWIKKIDRPREGKVWVGFFHLYVAKPPNQRTTIVHTKSGDTTRTFDGQSGWVAAADKPATLLPLSAGEADGARLEAPWPFQPISSEP